MTVLGSLLVFGAVLGFTVAGVARWRTTKSREALWNLKDREWCDDVLGCLSLDDSWVHPNRPYNVLPDSREKINTRFYLHTQANPATDTEVFLTADKDSIDASTFDPSKPVKFITHGFIDTGNTPWLKRAVAAFLDYGDYNVIRTNWGGGSLPMYYSATANTRVVGLEIAYLVNFLKDNYGVDPANVHLLGHSLGSHVSGYAGERIPGLGRISGLDPAGPYFTGTPAFMRLDPSDAVFVDNIHSDADTIFVLGYGTEQEFGNVDFYPNSGHDQPGCDPVSIGIEVITDIGDGGRDMVACSHDRAVDLYVDSLKGTFPYMARECIDYGSFETGRCASCGEDNSMCAPMGIHADQYTHKDRETVRMYLDTDSSPPFGLFHYQLIIDTAHPRKAEDWVQGHLKVWLYGDNGNVIEKLKITKEHERFEHGQPKYFLIKSHVDLSRVIRMEAHWAYDDTLTNPGSYCWMLLCNRALYVRSIRISNLEYYTETDRVDHTEVLCHAKDDYTEIKSGHTQVLASHDSCVFTIP